ncbi:MAG: hypothetical protein LBT98_00500 [Puniceicoccales bacterium]|nr:hypothetical protein [Puniceicoccales bacterium]
MGNEVGVGWAFARGLVFAFITPEESDPTPTENGALQNSQTATVTQGHWDDPSKRFVHFRMSKLAFAMNITGTILAVALEILTGGLYAIIALVIRWIWHCLSKDNADIKMYHL